jgi:hypothetical protein
LNCSLYEFQQDGKWFTIIFPSIDETEYSYDLCEGYSAGVSVGICAGSFIGLAEK